MGYDESDEVVISPEPTATVILTVLVRVLGLVLLLAGLITAGFILMEVWALYKYPERIEFIAIAVEKGSNIDKALLPQKFNVEEATNDPANNESGTGVSTNVRLSYFFAWFIAFFLILLVAHISMNAISTGGKLALYDTEVKKLARALLEQSGKRLG